MAVIQAEQVRHSQRVGVATRVPVSFTRASSSSPSLPSSSAQFISPKHLSFISAKFALPKESITSGQEKERFKDRHRLQVWGAVKTGER